MRSFYEEWSPIVNRQPMADENKMLTAVSDSELDAQDEDLNERLRNALPDIEELKKLL